MRQLPTFNTDILEFSLMQSKWASIISPILAFPPVQGNILESVTLVVGDNTINHKLGRPLKGWMLTRKRANSDIFDKQDSNSTPAVTLILNSSAAIVCDIWVF